MSRIYHTEATRWVIVGRGWPLAWLKPSITRVRCPPRHEVLRHDSRLCQDNAETELCSLGVSSISSGRAWRAAGARLARKGHACIYTYVEDVIGNRGIKRGSVAPVHEGPRHDPFTRSTHHVTWTWMENRAREWTRSRVCVYSYRVPLPLTQIVIAISLRNVGAFSGLHVTLRTSTKTG